MESMGQPATEPSVLPAGIGIDDPDGSILADIQGNILRGYNMRHVRHAAWVWALLLPALAAAEPVTRPVAPPGVSPLEELPAVPAAPLAPLAPVAPAVPAAPAAPPPDTTRDPLDRLLEPQAPPAAAPDGSAEALADYTFAPPVGFAGPSGVYPRSGRNN